MAKAVKKPRKKVNGYKMPEPIPQGEIFTDISKHLWKLGTSIGKGGFGEIYLAQEASKSSSKYPFVIKVEPHGNGPLFVEMHFYMKNAKKVHVDAFMNKHKLKTFGMPIYLGSGSHEIGDTKYRFIVMDKFGSDIDKMRAQCKGALPVATVFQLAWQITYVLEYIHDLGYIHADIKGGNVLLGSTAETKNQAYLVDFGLATKFTTDKEFKPNPKKAHDGTIEYLSRDAHQGVPTRRGDFEVLGYNLIHWLGGNLPWDSKLDDPKIVQQIKEDSLQDIPKFVKTCLKKNQETLVKFLQYVGKLKFNEKPDYKKIRTLFEQEVKKNGVSVNGPLEFGSKAKKRRSDSGGDLNESKSGDDDDNSGTKKPVKKREKKQKEDVDDDNIGARKTTKKKANKQEVIETDDNGEIMNDAMKEVLAKKTDSNSSQAKKSPKKREKKNEESDTNVEVMTEAMKEVLARKNERMKKKVGSKKEKNNGEQNGSEFDGYTAEMKEIKMKKMNNEATRSSPRNEQRMGRSRRIVPEVNYDERTPKVSRKKQ